VRWLDAETLADPMGILGVCPPEQEPYVEVVDFSHSDSLDEIGRSQGASSR
jgi:hypothetical protein